MSDKYYWGFTRHEMTNFSDSIDECIKEAKEMKGLDFVPRFIYIGEGKTYQPNIATATGLKMYRMRMKRFLMK